MKDSIKVFIGVIGLIVFVESLSFFFLKDDFEALFSQGYHPDLGFEEEDGRVRLRRVPSRSFWKQEFYLDKKDDTKRVFIFGSSVTRGESLASAYPSQLETLYNKKIEDGEDKIEVINLSSPGYGIRRKKILVEKALGYSPDLLIVHLDGSNEYEDERELITASQYDGYDNPGQWAMKISHLRFFSQRRTEKIVWRYIPREARAKTIVNDADLEVSQNQNEETKARWNERLERGIDEIADLAESQGVPLIFIVRGIFVRDALVGSMKLAPELFEDDLTQVMAKAALENSKGEGSLIYLSHMFAESGLSLEKMEPLFSDSSHLKPEGHLFIAERLVDHLIENQPW